MAKGDKMATAKEKAFNRIASGIDDAISILNREKASLMGAAARIAEIDAELAELAPEKARADAQREKPSAEAATISEA